MSAARKRLSTDDAAIAVRQRIVASARRHFLAHGFHNVTMDDLAGAMGMSKKTLYAHFASKVQLIEAVIRTKFDALNEELETITPGAQRNFPEALQHLLACVQRHAQEIHPAFVRDIQRDAPQLFQLVGELRGAVIERHFGSLFAAGQARGRIRKDISVRLLVEILLGTADAVVNPAKLAELNLTPESGFAAVSRVVLEGVLTARGRAHP